MAKLGKKETNGSAGGYAPKGYVARIDRDGEIPFGDVNEVNIFIMDAYLNRRDPEKAIDAFLKKKYPLAAGEVQSLMEQTEDVLTQTIYTKGYYFSELSFFPRLNHCKNHYYFEMMRENGCIDSNEWFVPEGWERGTVQELLEEKQVAVKKAAELLEALKLLEDKIEKEEYRRLWIKFYNLKLITEIWLTLTKLFVDYAKYFEKSDNVRLTNFEKDVNRLLELNGRGLEQLGENFYCRNFKDIYAKETDIECFVRELLTSFELEKKVIEEMADEKTLLDYVVCGGAMEGHRLQKEVNFSDTLVYDGALCRIPGSLRGLHWCSVNAHGWFSYLIQVKPRTTNVIKVLMGSAGKELAVRVTIGEKEYCIKEIDAGKKEFIFPYIEETGNDSVRIRFDKIAGEMPCIFTIKVKMEE